MAQQSAPPAGLPDVTQIVAKMRTARARGRGRRSPLYLWCRANHDRLVEEFERNAPSWAALADALAESGLTNGDNKRPTPNGARTTWYRVRREASEARNPQAEPALQPGEIAAGIVAQPQAATAAPVMPVPAGDNGETQAAPRQFGFAKLRGWNPDADAAPSPSKPGTPAPAADEPRVDVDDVLARFVGKPAPARRG